jgi:hypothetical protein
LGNSNGVGAEVVLIREHGWVKILGPVGLVECVSELKE